MSNILEKLDFGHVLIISPIGNGMFEVSEACDYYYSVDLTAAELLQLAEEIKALAEGK